jgi:hypothetical protein
MNKKIIFAVLLVIAGLAGLSFLGKTNKTGSQQVLSVAQSNNNISTPVPTIVIIPAEKIEVVHFHGTQQCFSCITVGKFALQTIKEKFPDEFASGKIVFRDINAELKENHEIVSKYQARGSSLFVNAIRSGKDDISEDVTVWRLVNNESQFISYFEGKLKALLGK